MRRFALCLAVAAAATPVAAQQPGSGAGCAFKIDTIGGVGQQVIVGPDTNYYAGGYVRLRCLGTSVVMESDSLAYFGRGRNSQVIFIGHVKYRDGMITMNAERGTYFKNGERWEARGKVVTENLANGSTLSGPSLDYYRVLAGVRDTAEVYAIGRPTIRSYPQDSAGGRAEPYIIVADRVRMRGNDRLWAGGKTTIDRSDFAARGDSLFLDSGTGQSGVLVGKPVMRGIGRDSFELTGRRIVLALDGSAITFVTSTGDARAVSRDLDLVADTIGLDLEHEQLVQTIAWGDSVRPRGLTTSYELRGDSLAFDTPGQRLQEIRAFVKAWAGGQPDAVGGERDWMAGDTVVVTMATWDSAGAARTAVSRIDARGTARSYYRVATSERIGLPSINYSRGDRITVQMKPAGQPGVERVDIRGKVDGIHLEPIPVAPDTAGADSTRASVPR